MTDSLIIERPAWSKACESKHRTYDEYYFSIYFSIKENKIISPMHHSFNFRACAPARTLILEHKLQGALQGALQASWFCSESNWTSRKRAEITLHHVNKHNAHPNNKVEHVATLSNQLIIPERFLPYTFDKTQDIKLNSHLNLILINSRFNARHCLWLGYKQIQGSSVVVICQR